MKLWVKIIIAMFLGLISGWVIGPKAEMLYPVGEVFLKLIGMIIVPLVLASMTVGITSIHDPKKLGRVGLKTLGLYLVTTIVSIVLGLSFAYLFNVGSGIEITAGQPIAQVEPMGIAQIFSNLIPTNPFASLVTNNNILQVIVFALFLGVAINFAGERGRPLLDIMESISEVMYSLTSIVMEFSPIGVFAIMAWVAGRFEMSVLLSLAKFLSIYYAACLIQLFLVFGFILVFVARLSPGPFFKGMWEAMTVAFGTCSSSATLPVSMQCVQENLGVSKNISSFVMPLGSTINMAGAAIFQGMAAIFISNAYGIHLDFLSIITVVITAVLSAVGAAGIPGSGILMLSAVLSSAGLPIEGIGLLLGIDRIREMISAVVNSMGDAVVAVTIAKQEGELDELQYYNAQVAELEESEA
ncbi:MAG: Proton/sodium-glutamate symport protein [Chlamydiae bacterium]|nr:Proton/sodium-glutamate symport protein [Chlamydiota bacterium]